MNKKMRLGLGLLGFAGGIVGAVGLLLLHHAAALLASGPTIVRSDRALKRDIAPVDCWQVLASLVR